MSFTLKIDGFGIFENIVARGISASERERERERERVCKQ
jgi:hypothetical protein